MFSLFAVSDIILHEIQRNTWILSLMSCFFILMLQIFMYMNLIYVIHILYKQENNIKILNSIVDKLLDQIDDELDSTDDVENDIIDQSDDSDNNKENDEDSNTQENGELDSIDDAENDIIDQSDDNNNENDSNKENDEDSNTQEIGELDSIDDAENDIVDQSDENNNENDNNKENDENNDIQENNEANDSKENNDQYEISVKNDKNSNDNTIFYKCSKEAKLLKPIALEWEAEQNRCPNVKISETKQKFMQKLIQTVPSDVTAFVGSGSGSLSIYFKDDDNNELMISVTDEDKIVVNFFENKVLDKIHKQYCKEEYKQAVDFIHSFIHEKQEDNKKKDDDDQNRFEQQENNNKNIKKKELELIRLANKNESTPKVTSSTWETEQCIRQKLYKIEESNIDHSNDELVNNHMEQSIKKEGWTFMHLF